VEVWYTSNVRLLRLAEEKKKKKKKIDRKKPQGKTIMSASAARGGHKT